MKMILAVMLAAASAAIAQSTCGGGGCTTISGTLNNPNGSPYNGTLLITAPVPFKAADGSRNMIGPAISLTISGGSYNFQLQPNDTAVPRGWKYTVKSAVAGLVSLQCNVPTSGSAVDLLDICTATVPTSTTSSLVGNFSAASSSLTFGTIPDGSCKDLTFSFAGITTTTQLMPEWPASLPAGVSGLMFASSSGTVDVRLCNFSGGFVTLGALAFGVKTASYALTTSGALSFGAITDGSCAQQSLTLSGALPGDVVVPTWPSTIPSGVNAFMVASSPNTITVNACNFSGATLSVSGTFGAAVAR